MPVALVPLVDPAHTALEPLLRNVGVRTVVIGVSVNVAIQNAVATVTTTDELLTARDHEQGDG